MTADENLLLYETFDAPGLDGWVSYVGGENEKTPSWQVDSGSLVQPEEDGLIRAILTGDPAWGDYSIEAKVRIDSPKPDARAGVVFRDDGRGFYVLRFTRSSGRAQLMYHSRSPFGWHELATVPVPSAANPGVARWVDVKVETRGPFIRCFVDGNPYIDLADSRSRGGRFGFYACEARASFDELRVRRLTALTMNSRTGPPWAPTVSFWFRETFTEASPVSWALPSGWTIATALCMRAPGAANGAVAQLDGAPFSDGLVQLRVRPLDVTLDDYLEEFRALVAGQTPPPSKTATGTTPARAGIVFRGRDKSYYALILSRAIGRLMLVHRDDATGDEELMGAVEFKQALEDRWYTLALQCKGADLVAIIDGIPCIAVQDQRHSSGYVGLYADDGPVVFTDLLAASGK